MVVGLSLSVWNLAHLTGHYGLATALSIVGFNRPGRRPGCGFEQLLPRMTTQDMFVALIGRCR